MKTSKKLKIIGIISILIGLIIMAISAVFSSEKEFICMSIVSIVFVATGCTLSLY